MKFWVAFCGIATFGCDPGWEIRRTSLVASVPTEACVRTALLDDPGTKPVKTYVTEAGSGVAFYTSKVALSGFVGWQNASNGPEFYVNLEQIGTVPPARERRRELELERNRIASLVVESCQLSIRSTTDSCVVGGFRGRDFCDDR